MSETIRIALYESHRDTNPDSRDVTWDELRDEYLHAFRTTRCTPCDAPKTCQHKYGPSWSPVRIEGRRANGNVREVTALVLDLDHLSVAEYRHALEALRPHRYILHSTHSHRPPTDLALRAVVAISRPVQAHEWPRFFAQATARLGIRADPSAKDLARLFFLPSAPEGQEAKRSGVVRSEGLGEPLDVDAVLGSPVVAPAPAPVPSAPAAPEPQALDVEDLVSALKALRRSAKQRKLEDLAAIYQNALDGKELVPAGHGQEPALHRLMSGLAKRLPLEADAQTVVEVLARPSIVAMGAGPEGLDHWVRKAIHSFERSQEAKRKDEEERLKYAEAMTPFLTRLMRRHEEREASPEAEKGAGEEPAADEPNGGDEWLTRLIRVVNRDGTMPVRSCEFNVGLILSESHEWKGLLRYNELTTFVELDPESPLGAVQNPDSLVRKLGDWFQYQTGIFLPESAITSSMLTVARDNAFDPLTEYVNGLPAWDGTVRTDTFLERATNAVLVNEDGEDIADHVRTVSRKFLVSAMVRAISPGEQVDTVLVLEGPQGTGKTSLLRMLAGSFYASPKRDLEDKDTQLLVKRSWIVEIEELAAFKGRAYQDLKRFLSATVDKFRPPYGRYIEDHLRRCIFIGTVNPENVDGAEYLTDPTGNRRFWPVRVGKLDREWVAANRDQVWAEALHYAREALRLRAEGGDASVPPALRWWLTPEQETVAAREVSTRVAQPAPLDTIRAWLLAIAPEKRPESVTTDEVARDALGMAIDRVATEPRIKTLIGHALRELGFERRRPRGETGRSRRWFAPESLRAAPQVVRSKPGMLSLLAGGKP